jgi:two-component system, NtrC family, response regulator PilR
MKKRILVVDDELSMREFLQILLEKQGYTTASAPGGKEAIAQVTSEDFDLVITDVRMPEVDGTEVLRFVKENRPQTAVIMITAFASMEQAVEAMRMGAYDYITKPFKVDEITHVIGNALERQVLQDENILLKRELKQLFSFDNLIGASPQMLEIYDMIKRVAPTRTTVLITGESGTGKELAAKAIHYNGSRKDRSFVTINCGAIPENLIESELFGHKKGSFTGAVSDTKGLFAMADEGTLFLDEVGELPFTMQVKLLRALQERRFLPVGATSPVEVDVRIIAATNKNLEEEVAEGRFREDLYYRLNVIHLIMPPLREHPDDIGLLTEHFLARFTSEQEKSIQKFSHEAISVLEGYHFPGNVRELENIVERAVALETTGVVLRESLPPNVVRTAMGPMGNELEFTIPTIGLDLQELLAHVERSLLQQALARTEGVKKKAAKLLNVSFRSFRYRLEKLGLESGDDDGLDEEDEG